MKRAKTLLGRLGYRLRGETKEVGNSKDGEKLRETQEKLAEKNRRLQKTRQQASRKDAEISRLREELSRARSSVPPVSSGENAPVFFLVGQAKSGTSWLMKILDAHEEIMCRGEGRFFGRSFRREDFKQAQLKNIQPSSLYGAILDSDYLRAWVERSVWTRRDDADEHLMNLTRVATDYFLTSQLSRAGKRIVGDKTPLLSPDILEEISAVHPEARVIHIIRDGRDVAVSNIHHMWNHASQEGGIYELEPEELEKRDDYRKNPSSQPSDGLFTEKRLTSSARSWKNRTSKAMEDGPRLLGENYAEVRYEDLLERPQEEVGRLLDFLGAASDEESARHCVEAASFERVSNRERGEEDSASFFRKGVAGDWRNVFTGRDTEIFKEVAGDLLVELGYEKDGNW